MRTDYIALAIPGFFVLIAVELLAAWRTKRPYYRLNDAVADLGCGVLMQVLMVFARTAVAWGYVVLYGHRVADVPEGSALAWIGLFLGVDFFYYWFHRKSHEVNLLWGAHVVHHQSEDYNLAVALRQSAFQPLFSWVFYLPLAVLGFPPVMFAAMVSFNTLYQFWIHTRFVPKLGPLEWVLMTPSHHRVHHGRNPEYIDRNHGGTLIIWDRLFGTFEEERAEVVYGVTEPIQSFNPLWANFHYYRDLFADARKATSWSERIGLFFAEPGSRPPSGQPYASRSITLDAPKHTRPVARGLAASTLVQFVPALLSTTVLLDLREKATLLELLLLATAIVWASADLGGIFDGRRWSRASEVLRLALLGLGFGAAVPVYGLAAPLAAAGLVFAAVSVAWLLGSWRGWVA